MKNVNDSSADLVKPSLARKRYLHVLPGTAWQSELHQLGGNVTTSSNASIKQKNQSKSWSWSLGVGI